MKLKELPSQTKMSEYYSRYLITPWLIYCDDIIAPQREMKNMNRHTSQGFLPPYDNNGYDQRRSFGGEGSVYLGVPNPGKESPSN